MLTGRRTKIGKKQVAPTTPPSKTTILIPFLCRLTAFWQNEVIFTENRQERSLFANAIYTVFTFV